MSSALLYLASTLLHETRSTSSLDKAHTGTALRHIVLQALTGPLTCVSLLQACVHEALSCQG